MFSIGGNRRRLNSICVWCFAEKWSMHVCECKRLPMWTDVRMSIRGLFTVSGCCVREIGLPDLFQPHLTQRCVRLWNAIGRSSRIYVHPSHTLA